MSENTENKPLAPKYPLSSTTDDIRELFGVSCLYVIENTATGRKYVGQTKCAFERLKAHIQILRKGKNTQGLMQSDYDLYGADSMVFYVIKVYENHSSFYAKKDEAELIRNTPNLYNKQRPIKWEKKPYNYTLHTI